MKNPVSLSTDKVRRKQEVACGCRSEGSLALDQPHFCGEIENGPLLCLILGWQGQGRLPRTSLVSPPRLWTEFYRVRLKPYAALFSVPGVVPLGAQ